MALRLQLVDRPGCLQEVGPERKQSIAQGLQGLAGFDEPDVDCEEEKGGLVRLTETEQGTTGKKKDILWPDVNSF